MYQPRKTKAVPSSIPKPMLLHVSATTIAPNPADLPFSVFQRVMYSVKPIVRSNAPMSTIAFVRLAVSSPSNIGWIGPSGATKMLGRKSAVRPAPTQKSAE